MNHNDQYHYVECGLPEIYLKGGFTIENDDEFGQCLTIFNVEGLHRAIGEDIISMRRPLTGSEIRFLRKELDLSQKRLGGILGVEGQTVARWEKGENPIPQGHDLLLRKFYSETMLGDGKKIGEFIRQITELDCEIEMIKHRIFEASQQHDWHPQAA
jgi:putative transcriptional regulator